MLSVQELSYWERKTFFEDIDIAIIGAGIVGYSTALHIRDKYPLAKIVIFERGYLPSGASSKNAGFACFGSATELYDDIQNFGEEKVWQTVRMRWEGLKYLRSIIGDENLRFISNGSWDLITEDELPLFQEVKKQLPYFNEQLKLITSEDNVYSVDSAVHEKFNFKKVVTSFYNRLEGQIDTACMNQAFYELAISKKIHVMMGIGINNIQQQRMTSTVGEIFARKICICTNGFAAQFIKDEDIKPARAQVLITKPIDNLKLQGTFHYNKGYYYFRNIDGRILLGGGRNLDFEGETTTDLTTTEKIQTHLKKMLSEVIIPGIEHEVDYSWSGIMGVGTDKKPIIRALSEDVYCGVRLGGMGVAIGTLVGKELAELIKI